MGVGLIVIEKIWQGETWANTHAFSTVVGDQAPVLALNDADIDALIGGAGNAPTEASTDGLVGTVGGTGLLHSIIAFERLMHSLEIVLTRAYISDGKTPGLPTGGFATFPLGFNAFGNFGSGGFAPLNNALQIDRVPVGYNARAGRLQLRACLPRTGIFASAGDGVTLGAESRPEAVSRMNAALTASGLNDYFSGAIGLGDIQYVIPRYHNDKAGILAGSISGATPVARFAVNDAISRQVRKGKKRKAA